MLQAVFVEHRGIFRGLFLSSQQKTLHLLMRRLWGSGFDRCLALGLDSGFSYHYIQRFSFVYLFTFMTFFMFTQYGELLHQAHVWSSSLSLRHPPRDQIYRGMMQATERISRLVKQVISQVNSTEPQLGNLQPYV